MVTLRSAALAAGLAGALAVGLTGASCKVVNQDHCANQDVPGNEFCADLNRSTPYCSPCRRDFHGCVDFEPFACPGYADERIDESMTEGTTTGEPTGTGPDTEGEGMTSTASASGSEG